MELTPLKNRMQTLRSKLFDIFVKKSDLTAKREVNTKSLKIMGASFVFVFISVVFLMPNDQPIEFTEKIQNAGQATKSTGASLTEKPEGDGNASVLWGSPRMPQADSHNNSQINQNTAMILGNKNGNAKTQIRAGSRLPLRIMDKFIVSQDPVPILAELLTDSVTDAGLRLPAGTRFYGLASYQKGSERAAVQFKQISLLSGQIKHVSGIGIGKDGQPGLQGRVYSDGLKNTTGQTLTTFVGGLAAGSVETDIFGRSKGGMGNGLLTAVAKTATDRAQAYGEKLKAEREWIEVETNSECDVILNESMNLQMGTEE